jgi:hypothetical protein
MASTGLGRRLGGLGTKRLLLRKQGNYFPIGPVQLLTTSCPSVAASIFIAFLFLQVPPAVSAIWMNPGHGQIQAVTCVHVLFSMARAVCLTYCVPTIIVACPASGSEPRTNIWQLLLAASTSVNLAQVEFDLPSSPFTALYCSILE